MRVSRHPKLLAGAIAAVGLFVAYWFGLFGAVVTCMFAGAIAFYVGTPAEEWWLPSFPPTFDGAFDDEGGLIEFEGVVSERGWYGHRGIMRRTIQIVRVLQYRPRRADRSAARKRGHYRSLTEFKESQSGRPHDL